MSLRTSFATKTALRACRQDCRTSGTAQEQPQGPLRGLQSVQSWCNTENDGPQVLQFRELADGLQEGLETGGPCWAARDRDGSLCPAIYAGGSVVDTLETARKIQRGSVEATKSSTEVRTFKQALTKYNFLGMRDLDSQSYQHFNSSVRGYKRQIVNADLVATVSGGSTTGTGASKRCRLLGYLEPSEENERREAIKCLVDRFSKLDDARNLFKKTGGSWMPNSVLSGGLGEVETWVSLV